MLRKKEQGHVYMKQKLHMLLQFTFKGFLQKTTFEF